MRVSLKGVEEKVRVKTRERVRVRGGKKNERVDVRGG